MKEYCIHRFFCVFFFLPTSRPASRNKKGFLVKCSRSQSYRSPILYPGCGAEYCPMATGQPPKQTRVDFCAPKAPTWNKKFAQSSLCGPLRLLQYSPTLPDCTQASESSLLTSFSKKREWGLAGGISTVWGVLVQPTLSQLEESTRGPQQNFCRDRGPS